MAISNEWSDVIPDGQVAATMRNLIETKGLLKKKGSLYVGTGKESQNVAGVPTTTSLDIPENSADKTLIVDESIGGIGWKIDYIKKVQVDDSTKVFLTIKEGDNNIANLSCSRGFVGTAMVPTYDFSANSGEVQVFSVLKEATYQVGNDTITIKDNIFAEMHAYTVVAFISQASNRNNIRGYSTYITLPGPDQILEKTIVYPIAQDSVATGELQITITRASVSAEATVSAKIIFSSLSSDWTPLDTGTTKTQIKDLGRIWQHV